MPQIQNTVGVQFTGTLFNGHDLKRIFLHVAHAEPEHRMPDAARTMKCAAYANSRAQSAYWPKANSAKKKPGKCRAF